MITHTVQLSNISILLRYFSTSAPSKYLISVPIYPFKVFHLCFAFFLPD